MNDAIDGELKSDQSSGLVDLRSDLKTNLAAEFETALSSATELTTTQRENLGKLVKSGSAAAQEILAVFATEEHKD
jgi:hypothetical protein